MWTGLGPSDHTTTTARPINDLSADPGKTETTYHTQDGPLDRPTPLYIWQARVGLLQNIREGSWFIFKNGHVAAPACGTVEIGSEVSRLNIY